jgi:hypothetical protein
MENEHVISGLIRKRKEIAGLIEDVQLRMRQLIIDLDNIDATIRLFQPEIDLEEIRPSPLPPRHSAYKGRDEPACPSRAPQQWARHDQSGTRLPRHGRARAERPRQAPCPAHRQADRRLPQALQGQGTLRSTKGSGSFLLWEIAR